MHGIKASTMYFCFAVMVGLLAKGRGRGGIRWAVLALLVTPLLAGGLVLLLPRGDGDRNPLA